MLLIMLVMSGCVSERYFEARSVRDLTAPPPAARNAFEKGDNVALLVSGDAWRGKLAHVEVYRVSDDKRIYVSNEVTVTSDGHWWNIKPAPGKYRAVAFENTEAKLSWEFTVLR